MVSRLINTLTNSLTNLLQPPDPVTFEENKRVVEKALEKAIAGSSATPELTTDQDTEGPDDVFTSQKNRRNPEGQFFFSAETLDKTIVNQLQSPLAVESEKTEVHLATKNSEGEQGTGGGVFSYKGAYLNSRAVKEKSFTDTHMSGSSQDSRKLLTTAHSVPIYSRPNKENLAEEMNREQEEFAEQLRDAGYRKKEAKVEKLELQKRNHESIILTDVPKGGLQHSFKQEIDSLHKMIRTLTNQNEDLHQQLSSVDEVSTTSVERTTMEAFQIQLNQTKEEMLELSRRLKQAERENEDIAIAHHQEIAKLNRKIQEADTRYDHKLRGTIEEMKDQRKRYLKETKLLKQKLSTQESQYDHMLNHMTDHYGSQVRELSKAVSQLQAELMTTGNKLNGKRKA